MRPRWLALSVFVLLASIAAAAAQPQAASRTDSGPLPSIEEKTAGLKKLDGFFPLYWNERTGQLWMEISRFDTEVLHSTGYGAGLGSNDIGIDRGALAGSRIVTFERVGPKILMVAPNLQFRAVTSRAAPKRAREGRVRALGAVGLPGGRRVIGPRARRRHRVPRARRHERRAASAARQLPPRPDAQLDLPADDAELPEEHRDGGRADIRVPARRRGPCRGRRHGRSAERRGRRRVLRRRALRGRLIRGRHHPRAPFAGGASRRQLQTARVGPAVGLHATRPSRTTPLRSARRSTSATWPAIGCRRRIRRPPSATR